MRPTVTIVGLGPAGPDLCTSGTLGAIAAHEHRFVRTARHPAVSVLGDVVALDHHYVGAGCFDDVYAGIVDEVVAAAVEHGAALYAVPGSPMVAERSVELLLADDRVDTVLVPALSFADLAWVRLGIDPLAEGVRIVDARRFVVEAAGERGPMLVAQVDSPAVLAEMVAAVPDPPPTPVTVLHGLGTADERLVRVAWDDLCDVVEPDHLTSLYIPGLAAPIAVEMQRFVELVATLRLQCPWDAEQTHASLRSHLLEEAYEVLDAIDAGDDGELCAELGDVLLQVLFHAQIASEAGDFTIDDVAESLRDMLVRRHPHVFGDLNIDDAETQTVAWEEHKRLEREAQEITKENAGNLRGAEKPGQNAKSALDGVIFALPSLTRAQKLQKRAARVGFDWKTIVPVVGKVREELAEVEAEIDGGDPQRLKDEIGDLLFCCVNLARKLEIDPEQALRHGNAKFERRFRRMEALLADDGKKIDGLPVDEVLDVYWTRAKKEE